MAAVTFKIVDQFFDRGPVRKAVDRATRRELSRAGAMIRRTARNSIKAASSNAESSRPGSPPKMHTRGRRNLRLILFGYDSSRQSVVVGPVKFPAKGGNVPSLLEYGGVTRIRKIKKNQSRKGRKLRTRKVNVRIAARPYMNPALVKERPNFPRRFKNSLHR